MAPGAADPGGPGYGGSGEKAACLAKVGLFVCTLPHPQGGLRVCLFIYEALMRLKETR
ncbi:hypothetical protein ASA01S_001_00140 [Aeromonas salmonicida subsp. masoucida NBRC 13784]|nr:hypothetical protein ASA01S_001_00140 [Aeromonas salmonicida subsp. masoucida NBRC 13784]